MKHNDFKYDVFFSHSSKDKVIVRGVAERLRSDGLRVWLDDWEIKPGHNIPAKIEEGLEQSRVLVLCISKNALGSDWAMLESQTILFCDPLNKDRRFIPLLLDHAPIKGSLRQFLYINWLPENRKKEYSKLLEACRSLVNPPVAEGSTARQRALSTPFVPNEIEERILIRLSLPDLANFEPDIAEDLDLHPVVVKHYLDTLSEHQFTTTEMSDVSPFVREHCLDQRGREYLVRVKAIR